MNCKTVTPYFSYIACILCFGFFFLLMNSFEIKPTQQNNKKQIKGIVLGMHSKDYTYDYGDLISEIKATGAEWISLNMKVYQTNNYSDSIHIPPTNSDYWKQLEKSIQQAKAANLKICLFPIVLMTDAEDGHWRGTFDPCSEKNWYASYHYLYDLMFENLTMQDIDLLSIGSEFVSLQGDTKRWTDFIKTIKKRYKGQITYSANWDAIGTVEFYKELDYLGISAYFSLTDKTDPTQEELIEVWAGIKDSIKTIQKRIQTPIIFTELGYTPQDGINTDPWNYYISDVVDMQEQYDCYFAFSQVWRKSPDFNGVFFYDWYGDGGTCDTTYTPKGKPAVKVIEDWFGGTQ